MNVFIFHGTVGYPEENWFPWLKYQLISQGIQTYVPKLPTPEGQRLESWLGVYKQYEQYVNKNTIFVGHSLGCTFIFRILEKIKFPIKAAILTTPVLDKLGLPEFESFDKLNETFIDHPFDWKKIKQNCPYFSIYRGDDDPYIPINQPKEIGKQLGVELKMINKGGHLNTKAGFTEFPEVLEEIKKLSLQGLTL